MLLREVQDGLLLLVDIRMEQDLVRDGLDFRGVEELLHLVNVEVAYADAPAQEMVMLVFLNKRTR